MNATIRVTRDFLDPVLEDLSRPHPFADERVGFIFTKFAAAGLDASLVLTVSYVPLRDEHYVADDTVGARIGTEAIRMAHQRCLSSRLGCLHIHMHPARWPPWFSKVDLEMLHGLAPSLQRMAPAAAHGGLVIAGRRAAGLLWLPGAAGPLEAHVSIVGFPLTLERSQGRE